MTSDPESRLFDFATSNREPETEDEHMVTELHAALGLEHVPSRLRRSPVVVRTSSWRKHFSMAAALLLVITLLGASFSTLVPDGDDGGDQFASVPPVVLGLTGENSNRFATAITNTNCDLTGDIPIFSGINEPPFDQTSVVVTLNGEMKLTCNGEETVLAEGVVTTSATQTPHVLIAHTEANETLILNISTGESLVIPQPQAIPQQGISSALWDGWFLDRSTDDTTMTSIYNLVTLTESPVTSDETRVKFDSIISTAGSLNAKSIVMAVDGGFFIANQNGDSSFVAVNFDDEPRQMAVSPDGRFLAVSSYSFKEGPRYHKTTVNLYDTKSGETLQSWSHETEDRYIDLAWTNDGAELLFTDHKALYLVSAENPKAEPQVLLEGESVLGLVLTRDPSVIAISHLDTSNNGPPASISSLVNLETGDIIALEGRDMWTGSIMSNQRSTLVLVDPRIETPGETHMLQVVDAVTGEPVGDIEYSNPDGLGFGNSSWGVNRDITLVAFGTGSIWKLVDDEGDPAVIQIPGVPVEGEAISVMTSPDGYLAARTFEPYSAWVMAPGEDEWIEVDLVAPEESQGVPPSISFILGE